MKSKPIHHKEIQCYIWNRKNKPFLFSEMKKKIHGRTDFGGAKYFRWITAKYGLKHFKKDGKIWLQKVSKKQSPAADD